MPCAARFREMTGGQARPSGYLSHCMSLRQVQVRHLVMLFAGLPPRLAPPVAHLFSLIDPKVTVDSGAEPLVRSPHLQA